MFLISKTKTCVVGTQKNRLNELNEYTKHLLKLMGIRICTIYAQKCCLSEPTYMYNNN